VGIIWRWGFRRLASWRAGGPADAADVFGEDTILFLFFYLQALGVDTLFTDLGNTVGIKHGRRGSWHHGVIFPKMQ
jgi:hypothetical protein